MPSTSNPGYFFPTKTTRSDTFQLFNYLKEYDLIIHCGACMLGETEVMSRYQKARDQGIPMTNYGIAIGKMKGILDRVIRFN